jgi:hypothetical protein
MHLVGYFFTYMTQDAQLHEIKMSRLASPLRGLCGTGSITYPLVELMQVSNKHVLYKVSRFFPVPRGKPTLSAVQPIKFQ